MPDALEFINQQSLLRLIPGGLMLPAFIAATIWGFIYTAWYWPVATFFFANMVLLPLLDFRQQRLPFLYSIQPVLDLACIGICIFLWVNTFV